MSRDEFDPDLSSLSADYEILAPLRGSANTKRYLARHIGLNRDVTITVVQVPVAERDGGDNALTHYASDARTLSVMRHRNIVPVVEGRWLPDGGSVFAIVRARVRGETLEHVVEAERALPASNVANALEQVQAAIAWARSNGIVHRHVSATSIVFQQGSGRVLLELDPSPLRAGAMPDLCDDVRMLGELAYEMLSGRAPDAHEPTPLAQLRDDLPPDVERETDALMRCDDASAARGADRLISLLHGRPAPSLTVPPPVTQPAAPRLAMPVGSSGPTASAPKRSFGYNARIASAAAVVIIVGVLSLILLNRGERRPQGTPAAKATRKANDAAGDVKLPVPRDTPKRVTPPTSIVPAPTPTPTPTPTRPIEPPETRRTEPPRREPPLVAPKPDAPERRESLPAPIVVPPPDTITARPSAPAVGCDSPDPVAQETCLTATIDRGDQEMHNTYNTLIAALRRQAGVAENAPDPLSVDSLRQAQQLWTDSRTAACRDAGIGPLYAKTRAACYAERAVSRAKELRDRLAGIP